MQADQSIVDEVRVLLRENQFGSLTKSQFETKRSALLLAAEATLIQRREELSSGIASGTITGMQAADTRADLERSEQALREAASLVGVSASAKKAPSAPGTAPSAPETPPVAPVPEGPVDGWFSHPAD